MKLQDKELAMKSVGMAHGFRACTIIKGEPYHHE